MKKDKKIPHFESDKAAEQFVDKADLSKYDLTDFKLTSFELKPKDKQINLRLPSGLLELIKSKAKSQGVPYQRYIRHLIERDLRG